MLFRSVLALQDRAGDVPVVARSGGVPGVGVPADLRGAAGTDEVGVLPGPRHHLLLGRRLLLATSCGVVEAVLPRTVAEASRLAR
mgnify:FL=1